MAWSFSSEGKFHQALKENLKYALILGLAGPNSNQWKIEEGELPIPRRPKQKIKENIVSGQIIYNANGWMGEQL